MSGGGSSSETKEFRQNEPWGPAQPYIKEAMREGQQLFHNYVPSTYQNLVPGFSPLQELAMYGTAQRALQGSPLEGAAQGVAWDQMYGSASPYAGLLGSMASDPNFGRGPAQGYMLSHIEDAKDPNPAFPYLNNTSSGAWLGSNPYLDNMFDAQSDAITRAYREGTAPSTQAQFAMSGRSKGADAPGGAYNSQMARNERELMEGLQRASSNVYGNAYNMERQLMENATANFGNIYNDWMANQRAGIGQLANIDAQAAQAQLGAAGLGQSGFYQGLQNQMAAAQNAMNFAQVDYQNLANLFDVGLQQQTQLGKKLADAARVHEFYQTGHGSPIAALSRYYNQALPMAQLGGTSFGHSQTETQQNPGFLDYLSLGTKFLGGLPGFG